MDWRKLAHGNERQKQAYKVVESLNIDSSVDFDLTYCVAGTIPIDIDIEDSDIDIISSTPDLKKMESWLSKKFCDYPNFNSFYFTSPDGLALVAKVRIEGYLVEFFAVEKPLNEQFGFRHMIAEWQILKRFDEEFRREIRSLKRSGIKTEPAFAMRLGLVGDPYRAILDFAAQMEAT